MGSNDTQIMFPIDAMQNLRGTRGKLWNELLDSTTELSPISCEVIGFVLMMTMLCSCTSCNSDSFRAMKGCIDCSQQAVKRYKGDDGKLVALHAKYVKEVQKKIIEKI